MLNEQGYSYSILLKKTLMNLLTVIILTLFSFAFASFGPTKNFTINLDQHPIVRFKEIALEFKPILRIFVSHAVKIFSQFELGNSIERAFYAYSDKKEFKDVMAEIEGLAYYLDVPYRDMFGVALSYETDAGLGCTAILAKDKAHENKTLLVHNLDFAGAELLAMIYISTNYTRNGKVIYNCSGIAGDVGAMLCLKQDIFSIALNERWQDNDTRRMLGNLKECLPLTGWVMRLALENSRSYNEALDTIEKTQTVSGAYISIGGGKGSKGEGAVITRSPDKTLHTDRLDNSKWFIVQCNCDWNNCTGITDKMYRTSNATMWMNQILKSDPAFTLDNIFANVLSKKPTILRYWESDWPEYNESTISVVLMDASEKTLTSLIYDPLGKKEKNFVHTTEAITLADAKCLKKNGYSEVIIRALKGDGNIDANAYDSAMKLNKAGINPNFYVTPCMKCRDAKEQAVKVCRLVKKTTYDVSIVYVDVVDSNVWSSLPQENVAFLTEFTGVISSCPINHKFSIEAAIWSTKEKWETIMGTYSGYFANRLWYVNLDGDPSPKDFKPFGGWAKPHKKTFKIGHTDCGHTEFGLGSWVL